jgi:hypothetical protein
MRIILLLLIVSNLHAQTTTPTTAQKLKASIDTVLALNGSKVRITKADGIDKIIYVQKNSDSTNKSNMPNALKGFHDAQQKVGNNGKGFDVYQSSVDNMPVLKPDAQNLGTLTYTIKRLPQIACSGSIEITEETPLQNFKYYKPLTGKEKKLLELFKTK